MDNKIIIIIRLLLILYYLFNLQLFKNKIKNIYLTTAFYKTSLNVNRENELSLKSQ